MVPKGDDDSERRRELAGLAEEARVACAHLAELGVRLASACELVATIRSSVITGGVERTPASGVSQEARAE